MTKLFPFFRKQGRQPSRPSHAPGLEQLEARQLLSVTYHGGPLLRNPDVEVLFYGSQWATDPSLQAVAGQIYQFFQTIVNSAYMDMLNEYGVGRGSVVGWAVDPTTAPATLDDSQIQNSLVQDVVSGVLLPPDSNRVYFVFPPPGTEVTFTDGNGTLNTSGNEANTPHFLGYHDAVPATFRTPTLYYAVIPYPGGVNGLQSAMTAFQQMTFASSHELAESATDPDTMTGWLDDAQSQSGGGEIADLANGEYGTILGYDVTYVWSNIMNMAILAKPTNLQAVAYSFTTSREYYTDLIVADYQQLLGRTPAQTEINLWLNSFRAGATDEQVLAAFLATPEYYQRVGGTNKAWVDSLYKQVLNRSADSVGESYWLQALAAGQSRAAVAYGFTASSEHEQDLIQADYQLYLGRSASSAEVSAWLTDIQHGLTQELVAAEFASSDEAYYAANGSNLNDWLTYAYQTILDRAPDTQGNNAWLQVLENGFH
jgi:Domain of unknown function (DUF4214)